MLGLPFPLELRPGHKHVEAHQGRTRARGLPFPLTLQPDAYNKRAGRCSCGAPKCVAEEW